ncbi:hypothetical protein GCM10020255_009100 [Rhodococcus baikonurensis]
MAQSTNREIGIRGVAETDPRAGSLDQLKVTGDKVRMKVRVDNTLDDQTVSGCVLEVFGDVAARVDHDGAAGALVADQVRRV